MTRRTKIVATLGPATDGDEALAALVRAGVDVVRLNLSHGSVAEHIGRLERVRSVAIDASASRSACSPTSPDPRSGPGQFLTPGVLLEAGSVIRLRGRRRTERRRGDPRRLRRVPGRPGGRRSGGHRRRRDLRPGPTDLEPTSAVRRGRERRTGTGMPGVHLPSERSRLTTPTEEDLVLAETMASAGVEFIAVSFVRAPADMTAVREVVGDRAQLVAKIETERGAREPHRDPRRVGCDHGRPGRPRHRLPARGRAAPAEVDRAAVRRVRRAGDHGDADVGVDGDRPVADPGRGQRRRQRRVRRHRRVDAVGRDRGRGRAGAGRGHDEPHRRTGRGGGELPAMVGVAGPAPTRPLVLAGRPHHRRPHARRGTGRARRRRGRDPVLHAHAVARPGRWRGSGPRPS